MKKESGVPFPLGPSRFNEGINFAIVSEKEPVLEILEPESLTVELEKTGNVYHIWLPLKKCVYRYKIGKEKLVDPYAPIIENTYKKYEPIGKFDPVAFDWEGIKSPQIPLNQLIIYEMHVKGFTMDKTSSVKHKGKFLGVIEKLDYLKDLGINAIELMPVHEFNENEVLIKSPQTGKKLTNFWGYSTVGFFALHRNYIAENPLNDLKNLVKESHKRGIEVILDVVYNHTAEGNEKGPIFNFKILGTDIYYMTEEGNKFQNHTGCGNTINSSHPIVIQYILDSLRYFVTEFHIDGFRFDLAASLNRALGGEVSIPSALVEAIARDPVLANTKMIAEAWDLGSYQVGGFYPSFLRYSDWNGKYRDTTRSYIKGDPGAKNDFATRLGGSQDLYHYLKPSASINFVTCHDGFTLYDLVSYNQKHNEANGEDNRDGLNENVSWNCGAEGPTDNPEIEELRLRQMKNFFTALLVSRGIPMIYMGDEVAHTKKGNNNTWCQDNELNAFPWYKIEKSPLLPYVKKLIELRKRKPSLIEDNFFIPEDIAWHGLKANDPKWDEDDRFIALEFPKDNLYIAFNASANTIQVELPDGYAKLYLYSGENVKMDKTITMEPFSSIIVER